MPVVIPEYYRAFFLWIEPISTSVGAYFAWFQPRYYLANTHASSAPSRSVAVGTEVVLRQLANLYLAFTLNEALVLRATNDIKVWRALLLGLLIADVGHLLSCFPLGLSYYYDVQKWNAMAWGNIAFVYCGATMRTCFLLGVGMGGGRKSRPRTTRKSIKATPDGTESMKESKAKSPAPKTRRRKSRAATGGD